MLLVLSPRDKEQNTPKLFETFLQRKRSAPYFKGMCK